MDRRRQDPRQTSEKRVLYTIPEIDTVLSGTIANECWAPLTRLVWLHALERVHPAAELDLEIFQAFDQLLVLKSWYRTDQFLARAVDPSGATDLRLLWCHMRRRLEVAPALSNFDQIVKLSLDLLLSTLRYCQPLSSFSARL